MTGRTKAKILADWRADYAAMIPGYRAAIEAGETKRAAMINRRMKKLAAAVAKFSSDMIGARQKQEAERQARRRARLGLPAIGAGELDQGGR